MSYQQRRSSATRDRTERRGAVRSSKRNFQNDQGQTRKKEEIIREICFFFCFDLHSQRAVLFADESIANMVETELPNQVDELDAVSRFPTPQKVSHLKQLALSADARVR
jgi:hypothetical protein